MSRTRALRPEDIPDVVRLRRTSFRASERPSDDNLQRYYEDVFLRSPWYDEEMPSIVYLDGRGRPVGFQGVIRRPMVFRGEHLRVAVGTEFMVDPSERGVAGIEILRAVLAGPQDLWITDRATDAARALVEGIGGVTIPWFSFQWVHPVSPVGYRAYELERRGPFRMIQLALRPLYGLLDVLAVPLAGRLRQGIPQGLREDLSEDTILTYLPRVTERDCITPVYDRATLMWLLARLAEKTGYGTLRRLQVRDLNSGLIGWFIYFVRSGETGQVVQAAAVRGGHRQVLDHLLRDAWESGAAAVSGRLDPLFLDAYREKRFRYSVAEPWVLAHSRRPELLHAFLRGRAFFSRLEAEWWLTF